MLSQQEILKKLTSFEQDSKVLEPQGKQMENFTTEIVNYAHN